MSVLAGSILDDARSRMNDDGGLNWPDYRLMPKLQMAFLELKLALQESEVPVMNEVSTILTVPAISVDDDNVDMSTVPYYPTDMIAPIWLKERQVGEMNVDFVDMTECDFIPNIELDIVLGYWAWIGQTIMLRGALNSVQVQLRYMKDLTPPKLATDDCVILQSQAFLAPQTAGHALASVNQNAWAKTMFAIAEKNLDSVVGIAVKQLQNLPAKRKAYHRGGRYGILRTY